MLRAGDVVVTGGLVVIAGCTVTIVEVISKNIVEDTLVISKTVLS